MPDANDPLAVLDGLSLEDIGKRIAEETAKANAAWAESKRIIDSLKQLEKILLIRTQGKPPKKPRQPRQPKAPKPAGQKPAKERIFDYLQAAGVAKPVVISRDLGISEGTVSTIVNGCDWFERTPAGVEIAKARK